MPFLAQITIVPLPLLNQEPLPVHHNYHYYATKQDIALTYNCLLAGLQLYMAARPKAWFCGRLLPGIVGSNPAASMDICLL